MALSVEQKEALKASYLEQNPTPQNSSEIVAGLADEFGASVNSIRLILTKAEVYVKKERVAAGGGAGAAAAGDAPKRVSKADAIAELTAAITDIGQEPSEEILSKLTGKAALYFAGVIRGATS